MTRRHRTGQNGVPPMSAEMRRFLEEYYAGY
jgi:hypothetical protein